MYKILLKFIISYDSNRNSAIVQTPITVAYYKVFGHIFITKLRPFNAHEENLTFFYPNSSPLVHVACFEPLSMYMCFCLSPGLTH